MVVGVAVAEVEAAGAFVGRLQVARDALVVQDGVMCSQQRGADAPPLPVRLDRQDGQVVVEYACRMVTVQRFIEGQEVTQVRAGEGGQLPGLLIGRCTWAVCGDP